MSDVISKLPPDQHQILTTVTTELQKITSVVALVLGGSHTLGLARPGSDLDIGVYYRGTAPLPIAEVRSVADAVCAPGSRPTVTELYGWGLWVNGGAWIQSPATKVDLLYRNVDQVWNVIEEGRRGMWQHDYDQQPPNGFRSVVYFAETQFCVPLYDPQGVIAELKSLVAHYPEPLKLKIVQDCLWSAEFSLWSCAGFVAAGDVCNAVCCMTRTAQYLIHAIFALNEEYFLNDKHNNQILARLPRVPRDFTLRVAAVLSRPGRDRDGMRRALASLQQVLAETVNLANGLYQPRFDLAAVPGGRSS